MRKLIVILFVLVCVGCARIDYLGDSLSPTTHVDVFFDEADIEADYRVIGRIIARSPGDFYGNEKLLNKIKDEAMKHGGDAIIIIGFSRIATGMSSSHTTKTEETEKGSVVHESGSETVQEKKEVEVMVIRYKR